MMLHARKHADSEGEHPAKADPIPCVTCGEEGEITYEGGGYYQPRLHVFVCPCCNGECEHTAEQLERQGGTCLSDEDAYRECEERSWTRSQGN